MEGAYFAVLVAAFLVFGVVTLYAAYRLFARD